MVISSQYQSKRKVKEIEKVNAKEDQKIKAAKAKDKSKYIDAEGNETEDLMDGFSDHD